MEKIVLLCGDRENHRALEKCLETLFPECSIESMERKGSTNVGENNKTVNNKGMILDGASFC